MDGARVSVTVLVLPGAVSVGASYKELVVERRIPSHRVFVPDNIVSG